MPKLKTSKGARKRFKITGSGGIKRGKAYRRHLLTRKTTKRKRNLRAGGYVDKTSEHHIKSLLPYG
jgi:large subunit ribosomal protein L35